MKNPISAAEFIAGSHYEWDSPLPWRVVESKRGFLVECVGTLPGTTAIVAQIHETVMRLNAPERAPHDAAFIVRACNSHAALLRGCQAALAYLADPPSEFAENRAAAVELIRAAITAATESEAQ